MFIQPKTLEWAAMPSSWLGCGEDVLSDGSFWGGGTPASQGGDGEPQGLPSADLSQPPLRKGVCASPSVSVGPSIRKMSECVSPSPGLSTGNKCRVRCAAMGEALPPDAAASGGQEVHPKG